jgi:asparagine synthetase B (glutamine-hydrolysing)
MCGFLSVFSKNKNVINHFEKNVNELTSLIRRRGPSEVKNTVGKDYFISHALLAINDHITQPVENDDHLIFMNGELYNPEALASKNDTQWLLEFFASNRSLSELDGEYIIFSYDKKKEEVTIASDPFATKPCFYVSSDEFLTIASYQEPLVECFGSANVREFPPNFYAKISMKDFEVKKSGSIIDWDFKPQKNNFDSWNEAFYNSIKKRTATDKKIFLGLSSGYDSGLIVSSLLKLEKQFDSYSIYGAENKDVLDERIKIVNNSNLNASAAHIVHYDQARYDKHLDFIRKNSSNYPYRDVNGRFIKWMLDDKAAVGLSMICEDAINSNAPIYLSGQGADEILSDYKTRGPHHGTIRGNFTNIRSKWTNFDMGFQRNFLSKEERIPGAWGIEARYPFLDRAVVQEFLWLHDDIKNLEYKQCIAQLLRKNDFPFSENEKCGFNPIKSLPGQKLYK